FFFSSRRRHTRFSRDWSSDVCSSDLYLPNDKGGIVDDIITYKVNDTEYLMVVNASNIDKDFEWIASHNSMNAAFENLSDQYSLRSEERRVGKEGRYRRTPYQ